MKVLIILVLTGVSAVLLAQPANIPAKATDTYPTLVDQEKYYEVGSHFYTAGQIATAVQQREGHNSCGIRINGEYVVLDRVGGLRLCREKLEKQLDKYGFETALRIWKSVPPYEAYLRDIEQILYRNAYF